MQEKQQRNFLMKSGLARTVMGVGRAGNSKHMGIRHCLSFTTASHHVAGHLKRQPEEIKTIYLFRLKSLYEKRAKEIKNTECAV